MSVALARGRPPDAPLPMRSRNVSHHRVARRSGVGTVVIALILIFVGGYYVLRNTLGIDLPELIPTRWSR